MLQVQCCSVCSPSRPSVTALTCMFCFFFALSSAAVGLKENSPVAIQHRCAVVLGFCPLPRYKNNKSCLALPDPLDLTQIKASSDLGRAPGERSGPGKSLGQQVFREEGQTIEKHWSTTWHSKATRAWRR